MGYFEFCLRMPTIVSMNEVASSPPLWPGAWKPNETEPTAAESHIPDKSDRLSSRCASRNFARQIVGRSSALREVLKQVEIVAPTNTSVLIHGETGTGKELIAQAVHELSRRRNQALVKINCAAIPSGLLESELFGHERGAFTGALTRKIGRIELAHQGTLFLDEIGDIPLELQPKLLRVLQEREFERLGGTQIQKVNIRLVVASSRDLSQMVAEHQFRSDLYYRLNVFPVRLPALRDRGGDLKLLVWHFVKKLSHQMDKHIDTVPPQVLDDLTRYHWPGNIRELQNVIERAVILSPGKILKLSRAELVHESDVV